LKRQVLKSRFFSWGLLYRKKKPQSYEIFSISIPSWF
jgi:hypothetical protein